MWKKSLLLLTWALGAIYGAPLHAQLALEDGTPDEKYQDVKIEKFQRSPGQQQVAFSYSRPGSRYIRLVLKEVHLPPGTKLTIGGDDDPSGFVKSGPFDVAELLPPLVTGGSATITVTGEAVDAVTLTLAKVIPQQANASPWKSIYGNNDLVKISHIASNLPLAAAARSVVFLSFIDDGDDKVCSGFVLSSKTIMTNHHCVSAQETCDSTSILFDYLKDNRGDISIGDQRHCKRVLVDSPLLDYAVLELDEPVQAIYAPLPLMDTKPMPGEVTKLVQHPGGEWKQISEVGCEVLEVGVASTDPKVATDITHRCDTIGGSSGSPLLIASSQTGSQRYCVGALHHWGFDSKSAIFNSRNRAIQPQLIVESLKQAGIQYQLCK
ncbi:trypsin-like peptidase domain-containing protein [Rhizobium leguminosarum]|uniref:trypsin-like peptidase domain-containing protein n=1 Tax=Rhizobium leguminosarum TaxID=384 RepID=UPI00143F5F21|nr:trypsin-like peptidase domain-containing protein [Rhizobium leguminosarum]NKL21561.1 trypsin-like serine protease [Rhizobium leguminosarum bv. viciae]